MEFTIEARHLSRAMDRVISTSDKAAGIPILANVLITAKSGSVTFTTNNLDISTASEEVAEVVDVGDATMPAALLHQLSKKFDAGAQVKVSFEPGSSVIKIASGRSRTAAQTLPADDFPKPTLRPSNVAFSIAGDVITGLVNSLDFAISREATRHYLGGIFIHATESTLRLVATDGHKLVREMIPLPEGAEGMPLIIVPRATCRQIAALGRVSKNDEMLIKASSEQIGITCGPTSILSKLIDGTFPDYERVIPNDFSNSAWVSLKDISEAVDLLLPIIEVELDSLVMKFGGEGIDMSVASRLGNLGEITIPCTTALADEDFKIGFSAAYLAAAFKILSSEKIQIDMGDPNSPAVLREFKDGEPDKETTIVIMPKRL